MQYKYRKIDLEQFAVLTEKPLETGREISFNTDVEFSYDEEQRLLANKITLSASSSGEFIMKAVMTSYFEISQESVEELRNNEGRIEFNPLALVQFASFNYGALRGALSIKTSDTALNEIVIPPVYFQNFITSGFTV